MHGVQEHTQEILHQPGKIETAREIVDMPSLAKAAETVTTSEVQTSSKRMKISKKGNMVRFFIVQFFLKRWLISMKVKYLM